ncbi:MAG: 3-methyl-2-oxobutanoate hydroxymethyltransferase [Thermomicrobiales bacterium]
MAERERRKMGVGEVAGRKGGAKLAMVTAYDILTARLVEAAGIDLILVGDSLGMVVLGHESTVPVTVEDIIRHTRAVRRGAPRTHIVADLPFMAYRVSDEQAIANAVRLIGEGGADAVKLEGGRAFADRIRAIVDMGIPVMGHVGLLPQTGGGGRFRVQGRDVASAMRIVADAEAVAAAGVYSMVIELVPAELAQLVTERVPAPTIGIGAGVGCDGQVLVSTDLLGIDPTLSMKFIKRYAELGPVMAAAFAAYADEVRGGEFPTEEQSFAMKPDVLEALRGELAARGDAVAAGRSYLYRSGTAGSDGDGRS